MTLAWLTVLGVLIILFTAREVFLDLFHHAQSGTISEYVAKAVFGIFRNWPAMLPLAGPLSVVLIIFCWFFLLALGFSFEYWTRLPSEFQIKGLPEGHDFLESLYFSLTTMTTLGYGDISPKTPIVQFTATLQALVGFGLVTASVSWIVLLFPALSRMRTLARNVSNLMEAEDATGLRVETSLSDQVVFALAAAVAEVRVDLEHFPIVYYFRSSTHRASLSASLPCLVRIADSGMKKGNGDGVRLAAGTIRTALNELASRLAESFVKADRNKPSEVFRAFREHQLIDAEGSTGA
jgi:hypothetical protein